MICPKCRAEYRPEFTHCSDCGVPLVDSLPEPETSPALEPPEPKPPLNYDAGHHDPGAKICPQCGAEYRPEFTLCSDCLVPLVEWRPDLVPKARETDRHSGTEPVSIFRSIDPGRIALAKSILQSAGVTFAMSNERMQTLGASPFFMPAGPMLAGPVEIVVDRADADDARLLVQDLEGTSVDAKGSKDERDGRPAASAHAAPARGNVAHFEGQLTKEPPPPRPRSVTVALTLIVASLVVGALVSTVRLFASSAPAGQSPRWLTLAVYLVVYALAAGLAAALFYRRRWAYWVWLVLFALGLPALWTGVQHSLDQGALSATSYLLLTAADVAAAVLLLLRTSRRWYGVGRKPGEPSPWRSSDDPAKP